MDKVRVIALMGSIGGLTGLALAAPGVLPVTAAAVQEPAEILQSARNDFFPPPTVNTDGLVKWDFTVDPGISLDPLSRSTIKKIAYGHVSYVDVVETTSGVYSSDAVTSPNIQYPGIHAEAAGSQQSELLVWSSNGWAVVAPFSAGSFTTVVPFEGGRLIMRDGTTCAVTKYTTAC